MKTKKGKVKWQDFGDRFYVAGLAFSDYQRSKVKVGDVVHLVGEPNNRWDSNAVRVQDKQGFKLGYIPRTLTKPFWDAHDEGRKLIAVVTSINKTNPTWNMICIQPKCTEATRKINTDDEVDFYDDDYMYSLDDI